MAHTGEDEAMAHTGENEQALRSIIDFLRWMSVILLLIHFYYFCHAAWSAWNLTWHWVDKILLALALGR